jgi:hypothetical protein
VKLKAKTELRMRVANSLPTKFKEEQGFLLGITLDPIRKPNLCVRYSVPIAYDGTGIRPVLQANHVEFWSTDSQQVRGLAEGT